MPRPDRVCPFHADEQPDVVFVGSETIEWELTCHRTDHPVAGPYTWPATGEIDVDFGGALGLDLRAPLAAAVRAASDEHGGGWVEYGLVERAFGMANEAAWAVLLAKYDHRYYHPAGATRETLPYTASRYLAGRLGDLSRLRDVAYRNGRGTGYWSYLTRVSTWTAPGREAHAVLQTFAGAGVDMSDHMLDERPR